MSSRFIWNLVYVVEPKFVLPQDINPVWTHYAVSELKTEVEIIELIDTLDTLSYVCDVSASVWLHIILYICVTEGNPLHQNIILFTLLCRLIV